MGKLLHLANFKSQLGSSARLRALPSSSASHIHRHFWGLVGQRKARGMGSPTACRTLILHSALPLFPRAPYLFKGVSGICKHVLIL